MDKFDAFRVWLKNQGLSYWVSVAAIGAAILAACQLAVAVAAWLFPVRPLVPTAVAAPTARSSATARVSPSGNADDRQNQEEATPNPRTATVQALLTQASIAQTQAAADGLTATATSTAGGTPPDTSLLDLPALLGLTVLLLVVIFAARRLRTANEKENYR